jgi:hypothetical protein
VPDFTKAIVYSPVREGRKLVDFVNIGRGDGHLYKQANESEYDPEIVRYIRTMDPKPGLLYALINALGAGEFWGSNSNADFFPEEALAHEGKDYGHQTFIHFARPYKHHINKPDSPAYGEVCHSAYNPRMHRVELVVGVDKTKAPDIVERIEDGDDVPVSMGCRVPYDVCSICGNKAKSTDAYCSHMREAPNKIMPDGRRVCVLNLTPKFFDISFVLVGADKTARVMDKVASHQQLWVPYDSGVWAAKMGYLNKDADIIKEVPGTMESAQDAAQKTVSSVNKGIAELSREEEPLSKKTLKQAAAYDLNGTLATLTQAGMVLSPSEFQTLTLENMGMGKQANDLESRGVVFNETAFNKKAYQESFMTFDFSVENTIQKVAELISPYLEKRSAFPNFLGPRVEEKLNLPNRTSISATPVADSRYNDPSVVPLLGSLAAIYAAYRDKIPTSRLGDLDRLVAKNPALLALLAGGTAASVMGINRLLAPAQKTAGPLARVLGIPAAAYLYGAHQQRRQWRGEELNPLQNLFANYPAVPAIVGVGVGEELASRLAKLGSEQQNNYLKFIRRLPSRTLVKSGSSNMVDYKTLLDLISLSGRQAAGSTGQ